MKTQVLFQILLSVCLSISTACYGQTKFKAVCYGQTKYELLDLDVKKSDYDLQGTLQISQSYDKQTQMLTLKIKNEYKHDIILFQSITPHLFVCFYKKGISRTPINVAGEDITVRKKIIKPDSTHVIPYDCGYEITNGYKQVSFEASVPYFLVDEKEEVIAIGCFRLEEKRFDL